MSNIYELPSPETKIQLFNSCSFQLIHHQLQQDLFSQMAEDQYENTKKYTQDIYNEASTQNNSQSNDSNSSVNDVQFHKAKNQNELKFLSSVKNKKMISNQGMINLLSKIQGYTINLKKVQLNITKIQFSRKDIKNSNEIFSESEQNIKWFSEVVYEFQMSDYSYLFKLQKYLYKFISNVLQNWQINKIAYRKLFQRFLDLFKIKIEYMSESRSVYSYLYFIQRLLQQKIGYIGTRRYLNPDQQPTDTLFLHFIQEQQTKISRPGVYYVRDANNDRKVPLSEYIATTPGYFDNYDAWKDIFDIVEQSIQAKAKDEKPPPIEPKKEARKTLEQILSEKQPSRTQCLGCVGYFQINSNIYQYCRNGSIMVLLQGIQNIDQILTELKNEVCGLLNSKGGYILFDCSRNYLKIIPRGAFVTELEKQQYEQKIGEALKSIYPLPVIGHSIFISWIPVVEAKPSGKATGKQNLNRAYVQGLYVCRMTVKPPSYHQTYFWTQQDLPIVSIRTKSLFSEGKKQLKGKSFIKFLKNRFRTHQLEILESNQSGQILKKNLLPSSIPKCCDPEVGWQLKQKQFNRKKQSDKSYNNYAYASVAVIDRANHNLIKQNLKRYNIQCELSTPFQKLKLRGAPQSSILYHDTRFDQLLGIVSQNKEFRFNNRYLLIILITEYIFLKERGKNNVMTYQDFQSLQVWLKREFPEQKLELWQYENQDGKLQYYMKTETRESTLYIYIVMTQFLQKSAFKDPVGLKKLSDEERKKKMTIYYPKNKK